MAQKQIWTTYVQKAGCFSPAVLPSPEHEEGRQLWVEEFCLKALRKSQLEDAAGEAQSSGVSQKVEAVHGEVEKWKVGVNTFQKEMEMLRSRGAGECELRKRKPRAEERNRRKRLSQKSHTLARDQRRQQDRRNGGLS